MTTKVNLTLYLVSAIGGIIVYFLYYGFMHALIRTKSGALCYRGEISARMEQRRGVFSGFVYVVMLILFYIMKFDQGNMMTEMYFFVALVGIMVGRSLSPLLLGSILPNGIYENVIATKKSITFCKEIKRYDFYDPQKPRDDGVIYLTLYKSDKEKARGAGALMIDRKDKAKIEKIMKQRMADV
jgi:hypothetical protein